MSAQSSPYQLIMLGLGRVGLKHLKAVKHSKGRLRVAAIIDTNPENALAVWQEAKMKGPCPPIYAALEDLPQDLSFNLASICTPSGTHYPLAKQLIQKKIHCFIEKPMTLNIKEAYEIKKMAEEQEVKIALGYIYRFFPIVDIIQKEIATGTLGRVLSGSVHVYWGHDQAYYDSATWRGTWSQDGGVLMNQCVHALDLMSWLMDANITSAQAMLAQQTHQMEAEDFGLVNYRLEKDCFLQLTGTTTASPKRQRAEFELICEKAELSCGIQKKRPYYHLYDKNGHKMSGGYLRKFFASMFKNGLIPSIRKLLNPHTGIYQDWIEAIEQNHTPRASAQAGIDSLAAILGAYASAFDGGKETPLPPSNFSLSKMKNYFS